MQIGVLAQIDDADRVLANVTKLLAAARERGVRTVFLRHYFMPTALQGTYQLRQAKVWQRKRKAADTSPLIPHGSPGVELPPRPQPRESGPGIHKITVSPLQG